MLRSERCIGYDFPCRSLHEDIFLYTNSVVIDIGFGSMDSNLSFHCRLWLCIGSLQCELCKDPTLQAKVHEC